MFKGIQKAVTEEYSGLRAREYVAEISQYHRIQASPGFRAAAERCRELLAEFGVPAEVLTFPANEKTSYWAIPMFQEWEATEATLHLVEPAEKAKKLADSDEVKCSLIQRSVPVDNLEFEVVLLEDGEEEAEYKGLDVQGKIVLTKGDLDRVRELAVDRHGAAGILFDGMSEMPPVRQRIDMADVLQYKSFWWRRPGEKKCFGFVLAPRAGDGLRQLIKSQIRDGKRPVRVRAKVTSRLYDGQIEVVSARIPGETDEEVVVVAHLCHPQPSANDNASGSAAALELARTLQRLIDGGKLARPRRSIRLLLVPEMTGTYAYLATHEDQIPRMVAGINLDMVGQNQNLCGGVFIIEHTPQALPSFAADLLERLREEWTEGAQNPAGSAAYPLFRHTTTPFSGGSDHYILSDPTVGVPTPMLIQWPDKFWHTSEDTLDKVDPHMLAVLGGLATTYTYFVANAGQREVTWLGQEMLARFRARLAHAVQGALTDVLATKDGKDLAQGAAHLERKVEFAADRQREANRSLLRLAPQEEGLVANLSREVDHAARMEVERAREVLLWHAQHLGLDGIPPLPAREPDEWERQGQAMLPSQVFRGPASPHLHAHRLTVQEKEKVHAWQKEHHRLYRALGVVANYWVDGKRTVADIADLVELETGQRNVELLVKHFNLMGRLGLVTLQTNHSTN
jgi:aminopeptidase YwaD